MPSIKLENIAPNDYARLEAEAAAAKLSLRNYVRVKLSLPLAKMGNPGANRGQRINQPKRRSEMDRTEIARNLQIGQPMFVFVGQVGHRITQVNKGGAIKVKTSADARIYPEAAGWIAVKGRQITNG